ncbi:SPOR domain-containing protein [soil metagenome]
MNKQSGGTVVGFIIGVVIGLGAALAVAVYVTKVPVPFLNKGQSRTADHDEAEAKKNRDWDPNAPLYGKNPAKPSAVAPAPAAVAPDPGLFPAPAAVASASRPPVAAASAARAAPARVASAPSAADPLGDLAKARAAATHGPVASGADPFSYFVQVGAYRTSEDAEAQRVKLSLTGVETKITEREQSGRTVFRVRAGPFDKKDDADKMKERLDGTGLETALVRVQR